MAQSIGTAQEVKALLDSTDCFVFDCDGVLWHFGDPKALPGVVDVMKGLRAAGKKVAFVTNNASKSRHQLLEKFAGVAIEAHHEEVYGSAYAAAAYLAKRLPEGKRKAFVVGMDGLEEELRAVGVTPVGGSSHKPLGDYDADTSIDLDPEVGAVVAGFDYHFTWSKCAHASFYLAQGAEFVATNRDASGPLANGRKAPGGGMCVGAIEIASGVSPVTTGKPNPFLLEHLIESRGLDRSRTVMVGDRLDTDIAFGAAGGVRTMLVMTGVTNKAQLDTAVAEGTGPTYVAEGLASLSAGMSSDLAMGVSSDSSCAIS